MDIRLEIMIADDTVVATKPGLSLADLDGGAVVLSPDKGAYYGLNGVGTRAFDLAQRPRSIREVIAILLQEYDAPEAVIRDDVFRFFEEMIELDLIVVQDIGEYNDA